MPISDADKAQLRAFDEYFETDNPPDYTAFRNWVLLKLRLLEESLRESGPDQRFAELAEEMEQLRLQVQPNKPFFFLTSRDGLPTLHNPTIKEVYAFLTTLERMFKLRNYELRLPPDSTSGWTNYATLRLSGTADIWATTKWGVSPDISWETFRQAMVTEFIGDSAIRELNAGYVGLAASSSGNIRSFNDSFREFRLLLEFVGKAVEEKSAIRDYEEKIRHNKKVALAFAQFLTVERIVEKSSVVSLADAMKYCENVDSI